MQFPFTDRDFSFLFQINFIKFLCIYFSLIDQTRYMNLNYVRFEKSQIFTGIEVAMSPKDIMINQRKYNLELLEDSSHLNTKPSKTPYDHSLKHHCPDSAPFDDQSQYKRLIKRLLYLTTTRSNIAFCCPTT